MSDRKREQEATTPEPFGTGVVRDRMADEAVLQQLLCDSPIRAPCGYCPRAAMIVHPPHAHDADGRCLEVESGAR